MKKQTLYWTLTLISALALVTSNIIVTKTIPAPFGLTSCAAIITIPIVYIVNDVMAECYGFKNAMKTAIISYAGNLCVFLIFMAAIALPADETYTNQQAYALILGSTPKALICSGISFIVGSLANTGIMHIMHKANGERFVFLRCFLSTIVGEFCDKSIFNVLMFIGMVPLSVIPHMVAANIIIAIIYETIVYPLITRHVIKWAKTLD